MAKQLPDLGSYTAEETMELALHALRELSQDQQIELITQHLFVSAEAQAELGSNLNLDEDEEACDGR